MPTYLTASVNRATVNETWSGTYSGTYNGRKNSLTVQQGFSIPAWRFQMPWIEQWFSIPTSEPPGGFVRIWYEPGNGYSELMPLDYITPDVSKFYWIIECVNGFGARDVAYVEVTPVSPGTWQNLSISGTWSFAAGCEEMLHPYFMDEAVRGADGSPTYGGAASDDIVPRAQGQHFYLRFREGGTAVASGSLTVGGTTVTASASTVVSSSGPGANIYGYYPTCRMNQFSVNKSGSMTATFDSFGSSAVDGGTDTHTDSHSQTISRTLGISGSNVSLTQSWSILEGVVTGRPGEVGDGRGLAKSYAFLTLEPQDTLGIACKFFAMDQPYPSPGLELSYLRKKYITGSLACNPFGSDQWTRRSYGCDGGWALNWNAPGESEFEDPGDGTGDGSTLVTGDFASSSADEKEPLRSWVNSASLEARGEEPQDWRTLFRGYRYGLGTLSKDATKDVGGGSGASRTWSGSPGNWEGYRFLRVRLKVTAGGSVEFTASATASPSKAFKKTETMTADTYKYVWFDLCNPDGGTWTTDNLDTRYPVLGDGLPTTDPDSRGVGRITALTISGGTGLTVDTIDLAHWQDISGGLPTDPVTITCAPVWNWWTRTQESGDVVEAYVGLQGDANGRRSADVPIASRQLFTDAFGAAFWVYSQVTINAARLDILNTPGWVWADGFSAVTGDTWHRTGLSGSAAYGSQACWIGGSGVTISGNTTSDFLNWMGRDLSGGVTMTAQSLMDEVRLWPRCGEVFQKGSTGGTTWLRTAKVLRGGAMGAVFGGSDPAADVTLSESPGTTVATDAVDEIRHYVVGSPYARMYETTVPVKSWPVLWDTLAQSTYAAKARRWWRVAFNKLESVASGDGISITRAVHGPVWTAQTTTGTTNVSRTWTGFAPVTTTSLAPSTTQVHVHADIEGRLWLAYLNGSSSIFAQSRDYGVTFKTISTVANAYFPRVLSDTQGLVAIAWFEYNSGTSGVGKIKMQVRYPGAAAFGSTIALTGDWEPRGFDMTMPSREPRAIMLYAVPSGGTTAALYESRDDGQTFKAL
jgi:hypothetical protein